MQVGSGLSRYSGEHRVVANGGVRKQEVSGLGVLRGIGMQVFRLSVGLIVGIGSDEGILQTIRNDGAWEEIVTLLPPSRQLAVQKLGVQLPAT